MHSSLFNYFTEDGNVQVNRVRDVKKSKHLAEYYMVTLLFYSSDVKCGINDMADII